MIYPNFIKSLDVEIHPILPSTFHLAPATVDLSNQSDLLKNVDPKNQIEIDKRIFTFIKDNDTNWGLSGYLEDRSTLLAPYPQMVEEKRYYHLGLDIIVPANVALHCPLDATVVESDYEAGDGNYGAFVLLEHKGDFETFYSFFGHLQKNTLPQVGQNFSIGDEFARTGEMQENGNWFYHTHLQVLTKKGLDEGWMHKGYCTKEQIKIIDQLCPSPLDLFRSA